VIRHQEKAGHGERNHSNDETSAMLAFAHEIAALREPAAETQPAKTRRWSSLPMRTLLDQTGFAGIS